MIIEGRHPFVARLVATCIIAVVEFEYCSTFAFSFDGSERAGSSEFGIGAPKDWEAVRGAERISVLDAIADQLQGNYEKLRTWKGTYRIHQRQAKDAAFVQSVAPGANLPPGLWQDFRFVLRFAIDMHSGAIYRSKETTEWKWVRDGSNETVTVPNTGPSDERSIVSGEQQYLHFNPKIVWPGFYDTLGRPEATNRHAAFRDDLALAARQVMGDLIDPRAFFGTSERTRFDDQIRVLVRALKGGMGEEGKKRFDAGFTIHKAVTRDGAWYRVASTQEAQAGGPAMSMTTIFSPAAGMNAVSHTFGVDKADAPPWTSVQLEWKLINGIYVPAKVRGRQCAPQSGKLSWSRDAELQECEVNSPLEETQFTCAGLGMRDGDLVRDNIAKATYVLEKEKLKKLADFGEGIAVTGLRRWAFPVGWRFTIGLLLLLLLFVFVARRYRTRPARREL